MEKGAGMEKGTGMEKGGGDEERGREWRKESGNGIYFLPPAACGGGCERKAVAGGGEVVMMFGVSPPPKNSLARIFTPPQAAEGGISCREIPAFAGMEERSGNGKRGGNESGAGMERVSAGGR